MEILEEYKKYLSEVTYMKPGTIDACVRVVRQYFEFVDQFYIEKKKCMYLLSKKKVKLYRTYLMKLGYARGTINGKLILLSIYESFLKKTGRKKKGKRIAKDLIYKKFRKNILDITDNGYEEMIELAKQDSSKYYLMFLLYVRYGISERKIMSIKVNENFDADYKILYLEEKNIELSTEVQKALKQYLKDRKKFLGKHKNCYLFVSHISRKNGKQMDKTSLSRAIKIYYDKLINSEDYFGKWSEIY